MKLDSVEIFTLPAKWEHAVPESYQTVFSKYYYRYENIFSD